MGLTKKRQPNDHLTLAEREGLMIEIRQGIEDGVPRLALRLAVKYRLAERTVQLYIAKVRLETKPWIGREI